MLTNSHTPSPSCSLSASANRFSPTNGNVSRAVPVYKKKSKSLPQNYRPVSLLSIISKVMESIVNRQLLNFLESRGVLYPRQFGFRKGLSTTDLFMKLYHEWAAAAASGGSAHVQAIDIAGAFDKVSHAAPSVCLRIGWCPPRVVIKLLDWPEYPCSSWWAIFLII